MSFTSEELAQFFNLPTQTWVEDEAQQPILDWLGSVVNWKNYPSLASSVVGYWQLLMSPEPTNDYASGLYGKADQLVSVLYVNFGLTTPADFELDSARARNVHTRVAAVDDPLHGFEGRFAALRDQLDAEFADKTRGFSPEDHAQRVLAWTFVNAMYHLSATVGE